MIRVTVELVPHGDEDRTIMLASAQIINEGSGGLEKGDYVYTLWKYNKAGKQKAIFRRGHITGFPRLKLTVWDLLYRVLDSSVRARNLGERDWHIVDVGQGK